jgi:hypothetical protein
MRKLVRIGLPVLVGALWLLPASAGAATTTPNARDSQSRTGG